MAKKELEKSESSQSTRLQVFDFQVDPDDVSRIPSAKSQDVVKIHSSSKIIGLAGLQPVLGRWNANERETMNEYLLKRMRAATTGNDVDAEADDQLPAIPLESFREYIEDILKTPNKLEELMTARDPNFQYDRKTGEAWLMELAEEATKKSDGEGRNRLLTVGWKDARIKDVTRAANRSEAPDTGIDTDLTPDPQATLQDICVVGVQMAVPKDPTTGQFSIDPSPASSRRQSGKLLKGEGKDGATWSPASSEIKVNDDEDLRGTPGATTTSDLTGRGSLTADRKTLKPGQERQSDTLASGEIPLGRKSKRKKSRDSRPSSDKSRKSSKVPDASKGRRVSSAKKSEGRKVTSAKQSVGQKMTSPRQSGGRRATSAKHSAGRKVTSAGQSEGQKVTSARQSQGQKVTSGKKTKGQKSKTETSADIESDVGDTRGPMRKMKTKKERAAASDPVRSSVEDEDVLEQSHQTEASLNAKLSESSPAMDGMAVETPLPTESPPPGAAGKEKPGLKKNAKKRGLKTKAAPRTMPAQSITLDGRTLEEPEWDPDQVPNVEIREMDLLEHQVEDDAPWDILDHSAELTHGGLGQLETHSDGRPKGPAVASSALSQSQDPLYLFQQLCLIRQTMKDNIFFGYYFTRAFVFSYFRTKPSHYDPNTSGSLLRSDVLDAAQRRLLRDLAADPYRYRCLRDVRLVEGLLALAKTAGRQCNATSPIARQLDRLPDVLGHALKT